jgi:hypothetical protein
LKWRVKCPWSLGSDRSRRAVTAVLAVVVVASVAFLWA